MEMNLVNWVEIPVADMDRAKKFYSNVFNCELTDAEMEGSKMAMFPMIEGAANASGSLVYAEGYEPSTSGSVIYFACEDLNNELGRVDENGGKTILPKTSIGESGFFAQFMDTEGNRVGLYSIK